MSRHYEREAGGEYVRNPSRYHGDQPPSPRDHSPDYYFGGGGGGGGGGTLAQPHGRGPVPVAGPYTSGAIPAESAPARPYNELDLPMYPRDSNALLVPPPPRYRPRSLPPQGYAVARPRTRSRSRSRSPIGKARHAIDGTFTNSSSGVGVGLLGAVVGGLAAREVSDATVRSRKRKDMENGTYRPRSPGETERARVISTVVGALVGGLGANAIERRFEVARERNREEQEAWERKWGKERDLPHYDTGNDLERDHGRGRARVRCHDDWDDDYYVHNGRRPGRLRSEEHYSYRN